VPSQFMAHARQFERGRRPRPPNARADRRDGLARLLPHRNGRDRRDRLAKRAVGGLDVMTS
jgi:hypothetical protein